MNVEDFQKKCSSVGGRLSKKGDDYFCEVEGGIVLRLTKDGRVSVDVSSDVLTLLGGFSV